MSKRRISGREKPPAPAKRRKLDSSPTVEPASKEIKNVKDLKELLFFDQGSIPTLHRNIVRFEQYVGSLRNEAAPDSAVKDTLLHFLQSESWKRDDAKSSPLAPLFKCWSYATQTEHDQLLRAIPGALATLLFNISSKIEFREVGLQVCKDLLQEEQLACIDKCLKPSRHKAGVIIACLRLLTQTISFDGGSLALKVYRQGDIYRQLEMLLTMSSSEAEIPEKKKRYHVSIRDCAVRFLLANLRYQVESTKAELIGQGNMVRNLVKGLENDPASLVRETLTVVKQAVLEDRELGNAAKSRFLLDVTLTQVARLYRYAQGEEEGMGNEDISTLAHEFLLAACVPKENAATMLREELAEPSFDVAAESSSGSSLVKSKGLLILLSKLRPHASSPQKTLALAIFRTHPHLVHDYFKEATFQFDPKLTATWIGYSSFLLSVIMLPLPASFALEAKTNHGAVTVNAIRDSILPPSLNRDVLERCLNLQKEPLIAFFATRLLIAAFQKVQAYTDMIRESANFKTASRSLLDWVAQRCPRGRVVVGAYRLLGDAASLQKEQLSRLLLHYYALAPRLVVDAKFDVGPVIAEALNTAQSKDHDEVFQMQLSHLLRIASLSPAMRWWNPPSKSLSYSPFVSVLRAYISGQPRSPELLNLLQSVLKDNSMLQTKRLDLALDALVKSLETETEEFSFHFLDNAFFHLSKHDLKYTSMLFELVDRLDLRRDKEMPSFSPLAIVIGDQWTFAVAAKTSDELVHIAQWIVRYFEAVDDIGESRTILRSLRDEMVSKTSDAAVQSILQKALLESKRLPILHRQHDPAPTAAHGINTKPTPSNNTPTTSISTLFSSQRSQLDSSLAPPSEPASHPELIRHRRLDVSDSLDEGVVSQLMQNLSSTHQEIRLQSLSALRAFTAQLSTATIPSQPQLYLLLNELIETAAPLVATSPVSAFACALARAALPVLQNPLHHLYPKVNDFLLQRPAWAVERLPSYWLRSVLQSSPAQTGSQGREIAWLIERLIEGLHSKQDIELYRGNGVVERLLARVQTGLAAESVADGVLRLIYRLSFFEHGSTVFLTRWGGLAWLEAELARCVMQDEIAAKDAARKEGVDGPGPPSMRRLALLALLDRLAETCDAEHLRTWSAGQFERTVKSLKSRYT